jgi:hypothetical protein
MLDGLNRGRPELSIGKNNKRKKILKMTAGKVNGVDGKSNGISQRTMNQNIQDMF